MSSFRSRTLWSLFAVLIVSPLFAQDLAVAPQAPPNAIPEGTRFLIRLNDKLDTRDTGYYRLSFTGGAPEMKTFALGLHPIGRFGTPMEVAEAVVWMCSDRASFMTGQSLVLDGGFLAGPNSPG